MCSPVLAPHQSTAGGREEGAQQSSHGACQAAGDGWSLNLASTPRFLVSDALLGEGAWVINEGGEVFLTWYDSAGEAHLCSDFPERDEIHWKHHVSEVLDQDWRS